ncbi:thioredoxin domain-containing protein [Asticcacaulis sp. BYS171W]|uniref:Thioredoxin domain-containing protein n=1 Tax=Asticcacaulis aquaticus TaxID=2984212 RepID=A0ABT5HV60_9CAUL|nr:thioredoxin domain-containing protein [Asticcacaulis aquaticus]MDC7683972.1 thioredoxin domain-containing protein [Asticcacaulis aquaticus]
MTTLIVRRSALTGLMGLTALSLAACGQSGPTGKISVDEITAGKADAPVTVVEYASVACPICAQVNETITPALMKKYVETGKVRYVYRPMMTGNAAVAAAGHMLANCVAKDKALTVVDAIMRAQPEMDQGGAPEQYANARPVLLRIAQSTGMNETQFNACVTDPDGLSKLNDLNQDALSAGVTGTPTFMVNGKTVQITRNDASELEAAIEPLLKK